MSIGNRVLGIDIGGTNIRAGMVKEDGSLACFCRSSSQEIFGDGKDPIKALAQWIAEYIGTQAGGEMPKAVAIGLPSAINREKTVILSTSNLPGLNGLNLPELLAPLVGVPVFMDRDVNMLMRYDLQMQNLWNNEICIGCYIGTGCGNAIYMKEKGILSGKNGVAAELGHIPVWGNQRICGCGNTGCIETLASGRYLGQLRDRYFSGTKMEDLFVKHSCSKELTDYVDLLAIPIATEINLLDPDVIILGGGVLFMKDFPMGYLKENIRKYCRKPYPEENLVFAFSNPGQENGVIGAGIYAYERMGGNQK